MRSLSERIINVDVIGVPCRRTKDERPGDEPSIVHFCMEGAGGTLYGVADGQPFTPPEDNSTIVVLHMKGMRRL